MHDGRGVWGSATMSVMTAQQVLPMTMVPGVVRVGAAADLLEDSGGGEVFIHGNLTYAWSGDDQALRRLTAVQLVEMQVAKVGDVADAFGVDTATLWRWRREFAGAGVGGLVPDKRGPKGASKLTASVIADIRARRQAGASLRAVAAATGVSTGSVRRALTPATSELDAGDAGDAQGGDAQVRGRVADLPVLAVPAARTTDRVAARWHGIECAGPVFTPAAQVRQAGVNVFTPAAQAGAAGKLQAAIAHHHLSRGDADIAAAGLVLYVDGHVRAYQGTKRIGKTHLSRLRFPAPATVETWVAGGDGGPVLVVMSEPGASLAGELARLLPELRTAVEADQDPPVVADRGGWSPALFAHMAAAGFDPLTWRKGTIPDLPAEQFTDVAFTGDSGREYTWHLADTVVALPIDDHGGVFPMRQVTRWDTKKLAPRQVHVLTTRTDLSAAQVIYRMGARWRLENYFRYARMHFDLDSHHCYASADDDAQRLVPNPAKRAAHLDVQAVRARHDRAQGRTDAAMLAARSPAPGTQTILTNPVHDAITADLRAAGADLAAAQQAHKTIPTRVPLGELHPGQQVLDVETKLITHAISAAAFNTINALARDIRLDTGYARANHEAHTLARHVLTHSGDIDPSDGVLTVRLDPMPTARATAAIRELCEHLTATGTRYPGTDLTLRYEIKTRP